MGYYKMLAVVFVTLLLSVVVQGNRLFSDAFFSVAYVVMGIVLFIGTKFMRSSKTAKAIGLLLIFSVGFLSTLVLTNFLMGEAGVTTFFKFAIVFSLDFCALFFLRYGKEIEKEEGKEHRFDQHGPMSRPAKKNFKP